MKQQSFVASNCLQRLLDQHLQTQYAEPNVIVHPPTFAPSVVAK
jgi:hypothetical protein